MIFYAVYSLILLAVAYFDIKKHIIPDAIVYPSMLLAVGLSFLSTGILASLEGGGVGFLLMLIPYVLYYGHVGLGDVKLALLVGLMLGYPLVTLVVPAGWFAALGFIVVLKLTRKPIDKTRELPFGAFIALGAILVFLWGQPLWDWYTGLTSIL